MSLTAERLNVCGSHRLGIRVFEVSAVRAEYEVLGLDAAHQVLRHIGAAAVMVELDRVDMQRADCLSIKQHCTFLAAEFGSFGALARLLPPKPACHFGLTLS